MIFVMLGTQKQGFNRLLEEVENCDILKDEEIIAQIGHTKYTSNNIKTIDFIESEELKNYVAKAEFVITHGGVGSIFSALLKNKKVIAMPRLKKYGEHVDDHQIEICKKLSSMNYIVYFNPVETENEEKPDTLENKINFLRTNNFDTYIEDTSYLSKLNRSIEDLIMD